MTNPVSENRPVEETHCPKCHLPIRMAQSASAKRKLAEMLVPSFESTPVIVITLLLSGAIAGTLEFMTHLAVAHMHTPLAYHAFIDASVIMLMTIALVGVGISSVKARREALIHQLRAVEELHHHLRNSFQVIAQSRYLPEDKQAQAVFDSMDRIDEVLRRFSGKASAETVRSSRETFC